MATKVHLLCIDPQNDFCDPKGSLFVSGADKDIERLSKMMDRIYPKLDDIHITMDCHQLVHIAHPIFWVDASGNHPTPFTLISTEDIENGTWRCSFPQYQNWCLKYTQNLKKNNRYLLLT